MIRTRTFKLDTHRRFYPIIIDCECKNSCPIQLNTMIGSTSCQDCEYNEEHNSDDVNDWVICKYLDPIEIVL